MCHTAMLSRLQSLRKLVEETQEEEKTLRKSYQELSEIFRGSGDGVDFFPDLEKDTASNASNLAKPVLRRQLSQQLSQNLDAGKSRNLDPGRERETGGEKKATLQASSRHLALAADDWKRAVVRVDSERSNVPSSPDGRSNATNEEVRMQRVLTKTSTLRQLSRYSFELRWRQFEIRRPSMMH